MRYVSQLFQPIISIPKNAKIKNTEITCKSQKLLLELGLVRPSSSGLFTLLPLARRALDKLESLCRACVEHAGAQRVSLPALATARLWQQTGRLQDAGTELMKVTDRHEKKYILAPTHEETIADLLADVGPLSYKQLPLLLYQISNKYRDEQRPKHGMLRAREFCMLDAYGAHSSEACARAVYERVAHAYRALAHVLDLPIHRVQAPSGEMGGSLSHEWQLCASAGEDALAICASCSHTTLAREETKCEKCGKETERVNSIEVGHTFILGTKYSEALRAHFIPPAGAPEPIIMSCFGIGISRLLAASLEALSSEQSLRWPEAIAPFSAIVVGPKEGSKEWSSHGWDKIQQVHDLMSRSHAHDVLIDDRHSLTIGKRLMMADRMGYPTIVVCGKSTLDSPPRYEVYRSAVDKDLSMQLLTLDQLTEALAPKLNTKLADEDLRDRNKV